MAASLSKQLVPTAITIIMIVVLAFVYYGVRTARQAVEPADKQATSLSARAGGLKLDVPDGWKLVRQGGVEGGAVRYAAGAPHAEREALFITRYPLRRKPTTDKQRAQLLAEAEQSLRQTGAPDPGRRVEDDIQGRDGWRYEYRSGTLSVRVHLVLDDKAKQPSLYQFSCQSKRGERGRVLRERCAEMIDSLRFP